MKCAIVASVERAGVPNHTEDLQKARNLMMTGGSDRVARQLATVVTQSAIDFGIEQRVAPFLDDPNGLPARIGKTF